MATKKSSNVKDLMTEICLLHKIIEIIGLSNNLENMLQQIAKALTESIKGDSCLIYLLDANPKKLVLSGAWPPHPYQIGKLKMDSGEGITGWVIEHIKPVALSKNACKDSRFKLFSNLPEDRYEAFLSVPITLNGEAIGVINIQNRKKRVFTEEHIKIFKSIASQISGAIEKTKLIQIADKKEKQVKTLARLSTSIVSNTYLHEILQLIVTMTAQMMNSKIVSVMLLDEEKQELRIEATQSLSDEYKKKPPIKIGESVSGRAIKLRKPVAIFDVTKELGYGYPKIAKAEGLVSMLAVPMLIKDKPIGVINCYTSTEHVFAEDEIFILQAIANQSAVAIENTRLFQESKTAKDALEVRKIVERAKGLLMKGRSLTEEEAFSFMQKQAMNLRRTMREIAEAILLTEGLKDK
jgi:signal transduction protein with GAF and PtsI domain